MSFGLVECQMLKVNGVGGTEVARHVGDSECRSDAKFSNHMIRANRTLQKAGTLLQLQQQHRHVTDFHSILRPYTVNTRRMMLYGDPKLAPFNTKDVPYSHYNSPSLS